MKRLIVVGGGFAGTRAAQAAAAVAHAQGRPLDIILVSERDRMTLRPRLYLPMPEDWDVPLRPALEPLGVRLVLGRVSRIDPVAQRIGLASRDGEPAPLRYDALVLATGSRLRRWPVAAGHEGIQDVDTASSAARLLQHIRAQRQSGARGLVFVVVGAGFTGLEVATELRKTVGSAIGGEAARAARILLVDRDPEAAGRLGRSTRPVIEAALAAAEIETRFGRSIVSADEKRVVLDDGETIVATTIIHAGGMEAAGVPIAADVDRDELSRLRTDDLLRVRGFDGLFAAGDAAHARVDERGRAAPMSCQHAIPMGDRAGRNAAAHLIGLPLTPYRQPAYVTCLDLGAAGAMLTAGWERQVMLTGEQAKTVKLAINAMISPPAGTADAIMTTLDVSMAGGDDLGKRLVGLARPVVAT